MFFPLLDELRQKESARRLFLAAALALCWLPGAALADGDLDAGGLAFKDFAVPDNGASFNRGDPMFAGGPNQVSSRVLAIDTTNSLARVRFDAIRVEVTLPLGWQATEDWERGVGYSGDRRYRLIVWRVDFDFEGVKDAEHYAATKSGSIRARRPTVRAQARKLSDGSFLIVYENVQPSQGDGGGSRVVFDLMTPNPRNPKEGVLMTLGVPASDSARGLKLMALLKSKLRIDW